MDSKDELLEDDEQEIKPDEEEEGQEKQNKNDNFHVLAVDDSLIDRKILEKLLTHSSYHVTCVESGDKALEYLGLVDHHRSSIDHHHLDHDPDIHSSFTPSDHQHHQVHETRVNLIMTDYSMPGITGYDLLKKVKGSSWKDVPVVVMSSENVPSRIHMCLEGGAEEFLLKPVRESDVKKLHPHVLKSVCCGNNIRAKLAETSCNLGVNQSPNHGDYEEEIMIRDLSSCFDKGKAKVDDDQCLDRRRVNMEGLTAPVNV